MKPKNIVGKRVHEARLAATPPITQSDLIARLQLEKVMISQSALSKVEHGQRPVTDFELTALAKALKVPLGWLLGEGPTKKPQSRRSPE